MSPRIVVAVLLLLAACASTSTHPLAAPPTVKVVITAEPSLHKLIDVAKITADTELALRRFAPAAMPATVTMHFTGTSLVNGGPSASSAGAEVHGNPEEVTYRYAVASFSQTPWLDGFQPVIATRTVPAGTLTGGGQGVSVVGTYSITGANGVMLEEGPILTAPGYNNQRELAWFVARRVKELTRKSS